MVILCSAIYTWISLLLHKRTIDMTYCLINCAQTILGGRVRVTRRNSRTIDTIFEYEPSSQSWKTAGHLQSKRQQHAVAVIDIATIQDHCQDSGSYEDE